MDGVRGEHAEVPWSDQVLRHLTGHPGAGRARGSTAVSGRVPEPRHARADQAPEPLDPGPADPVLLDDGPAQPERLQQQPPVGRTEPDLTGLLKKPRHGDPLLRRGGRWTAHLFGASARDERALAQAAEGVRRPVSTGRRIGVRGVRGGSGATTVAALLAVVYARRRSDTVLAVDAVPDLGWLGHRLGTAPADPRDLDEVIGHAVDRPVTAFEQQYVLPRAGALHVLPGAAPGGRTTAEQASAVLARHFAVTVLDGPSLGLRASGLDDVHAAVLVAPASPDGVRRAVTAVAEHAGPAPAVVLVSHQADDRVRLRPALAAVWAAGAPAVHLPYDRHLAAGGALEPGRLSARAVRAATELAAEVLEMSVAVHRDPGAGPWPPGPVT